MIEEHLYFAGCVFWRWQHLPGWEVVAPVYFQKLPRFFKHWLPSWILRPQVVQSLWCQGVGRFTHDEVSEKVFACLSALSVQLGGKRYFGGEKLSLLDFSAFGQLEAILNSAPVPSPAIAQARVELPNLLRYVRRLKREFFPELIEHKQSFAPSSIPSLHHP